MLKDLPDDLQKIHDRIDKHMEREEAEQREVREQLTKMKVWFAVLGFIGGMFLPSIWAIVWASILNSEAVSILLGHLSFNSIL